MENLIPSQSGGTLYKVIAGSFRSKANADECAAFLNSKSIESFVVTTAINGETWYRVQAGAFTTRANAENRLATVKHAGIQDAFLVAETSSQPDTSDKILILGPISISAEQMNQFAKSINPKAPELGALYQTLGGYYGIRGDVAFAQALHETDYFRYTGDVRTEQNNYSGIGATGGEQRGASFATPEEGVLAHLQHLYAYATTAPLPNQYNLVDPRFHLVQRGSAPAWVDLNGKWAVPGDQYGQSILNLYERMAGYVIES
ncbi:SPOR domain-containing protein [Neobacillus sp. K501]